MPTKCDFCSYEPASWSYPASDFVVNDIIGSAGGWASCEVCHILIERGDWKGLARRSADVLAGQFAWQPPAGVPSVELTDQLMEAIADLHQRFQDARTGPAVRLEDPPSVP